jgi:hypothetical protein
MATRQSTGLLRLTKRRYVGIRKAFSTCSKSLIPNIASLARRPIYPLRQDVYRDWNDAKQTRTSWIAPRSIFNTADHSSLRYGVVRGIGPTTSRPGYQSRNAIRLSTGQRYDTSIPSWPLVNTGHRDNAQTARMADKSRYLQLVNQSYPTPPCPLTTITSSEPDIYPPRIIRNGLYEPDHSARSLNATYTAQDDATGRCDMIRIIEHTNAGHGGINIYAGDFTLLDCFAVLYLCSETSLSKICICEIMKRVVPYCSVVILNPFAIHEP